MTKSSDLNIYVDIFNMLDGVALEGGYFYGKLRLSNEVLTKLRSLENAELTTGSCEIFKGENKITEKTFDAIDERLFSEDISARIDLIASHFSEGYVICSNWDQLLSYEEYIKNSVQNIFLTDCKSHFQPESSDHRFKNYLKVQNVYGLVKKLIHEQESGSNTIYYDRPLRIEFTLSHASLDSQIEIEALSNLLNKDLHKEAIKCLITKELVLLLKDVELKKRFDNLIVNLNSLVSNVLLSYQSYVDNYSFDKVRREYQEKKTEYVKKINDVFDTAATKLLSIPAALWFATANIKLASFGEIGFVKNIVILISSLILTILLILNTHGQFSILRSLKKEYTDVFDRLMSKFEGESTDIEKMKSDLDSKDTQVCIKLWIAIISSILLFIFTLLIFIYSIQ